MFIIRCLWSCKCKQHKDITNRLEDLYKSICLAHILKNFVQQLLFGGSNKSVGLEKFQTLTSRGGGTAVRHLRVSHEKYRASKFMNIHIPSL